MRGTQTRNQPLDGIRGIAIVAVMAFHFLIEGAPGGAFGVDLFFALSGFLITGILLREYRSTGQVDLAAFYMRRAARLLPALGLFLLIVAPPVAAVIGTWNHVPLNSLATAFYVSDFGAAGYFPLTEPYGHTWSLAVEEQFYLVWPAILLLALHFRIRLLPFGVGLYILSVIVMWVGGATLGLTPNYFLPTGHLPSLAAGCLGAFIVDSGRTRLAAALGSQWLAVTALVLIAGMVVAPRQTWTFAWQQLVVTLVLPFIMCLLLHAQSGRRSLVNLGLSAAWLRWFGTRSYGLYLYHTAFYYVFMAEHVPLSRSVNSLLAVLASVVVAELSYRFLEQPIIERGRRWSQRRRSARESGNSGDVAAQS